MSSLKSDACDHGGASSDRCGLDSSKLSHQVTLQLLREVPLKQDALTFVLGKLPGVSFTILVIHVIVVLSGLLSSLDNEVDQDAEVMKMLKASCSVSSGPLFSASSLPPPTPAKSSADSSSSTHSSSLMKLFPSQLTCVHTVSPVPSVCIGKHLGPGTYTSRLSSRRFIENVFDFSFELLYEETLSLSGFASSMFSTCSVFAGNLSSFAKVSPSEASTDASHVCIETQDDVVYMLLEKFLT